MRPRDPAAEALAVQADDPERVRAALIDSAGMCRNLWITFLSFGTYLVIAVGAVTHRQLLLEEPVQLPLLNVNLPLVAFFVVAPTLFLIFHCYLLLHLEMMADDVRRYTGLLRDRSLDPSAENHIRQQLPNFVFVRLLGGPRAARRTLSDWLLVTIAWLTVAVGPLALLIMTELQFLPYHLEWATWAQRAIIVLDLMLLWLFWPAIVTELEVRPAVTWAKLAASVLGCCVAVFCIFIATFPGETVDRNAISTSVTLTVPTGYFFDDWRRVDANLTEYLFQGGVDEIEGEPTSWFSNRLVVPDQSLIDPDKLARIIARQPAGEQPWQGERTIFLRGRDLRGAVLVRSDLRRADFTGTHLEGANLEEASMDGALFACAKTGEGGNFGFGVEGCAVLQAASLERASLLGTSFEGATLLRASLKGARLQGASLSRARLTEASLDSAQLGGSRLSSAELQGASLDSAELQGASLSGAQLQGAVFYQARLQGAVFDGAVLLGTSFEEAQLQGASFDNAFLRGALLLRTQLQGVSLTRTDLDGAVFDSAFVWRADAKSTSGTPLVVDPRSTPVLGTRVTRREHRGRRWQTESLDDEIARERIAAWLANVPGGELRDAAEKRLQMLLAASSDSNRDQYLANLWAQLAEPADMPIGSLREAEHAGLFRQAIRSYACEGGAAAAAAVRGMLEKHGRSSPVLKYQPGARELANDLLGCPALGYFDDVTLAKLKELAGPGQSTVDATDADTTSPEPPE